MLESSHLHQYLTLLYSQADYCTLLSKQMQTFNFIIRQTESSPNDYNKLCQVNDRRVVALATNFQIFVANIPDNIYFRIQILVDCFCVYIELFNYIPGHWNSTLSMIL